MRQREENPARMPCLTPNVLKTKFHLRTLSLKLCLLFVAHGHRGGDGGLEWGRLTGQAFRAFQEYSLQMVEING